MKQINLKSLMVAIAFLGFQLSVYAQQDLSIFGMKLGGQFTVPECNLVLKEGEYMNSMGGLLGKLTKKKYWEYRYEGAITQQCFKRPQLEKIRFDKKDQILPLPLPKPTAWVTVVSPANAKPALAADGEFYAFVLTDGSLDGINFKINKNESDEVFSALKQKYGNGAKITPMKWQNSTGAVYEYYIANWTLPKITIKFQSAGIFFDPDYLTDMFARRAASETDNAFASPYGMVQISQRAKETPQPNKIPL